MTERPLDRHDLYELCVQSPEDLVPLLRAVHGGGPALLGEDFCGTAALSRAWTRLVPGGRAIAVDHDPAGHPRPAGHEGVTAVTGDVVGGTSASEHAADVIYAGNFSIGEWPDRPRLLAYLRHVRTRLRPGGVFVCDLYGGETASLTGEVDRECPAPGGRMVRYTWEQREADPLTGRVVNAIHFEVSRGGVVERTIRDAFVYRWRLWGPAELREAIQEAGYASSQVFPRTPDAVDGDGTAYVEPIEDPADLDDSFDILVAARP